MLWNESILGMSNKLISKNIFNVEEKIKKCVLLNLEISLMNDEILLFKFVTF